MTTRYEITATKGDKTTRVCFTARRTKSNLLQNIYTHADRVVASIGADINALVTEATTEHVKFSDGAVVRFSGYTENDFLNA
jgi:hypothetical protein